MITGIIARAYLLKEGLKFNNDLGILSPVQEKVIEIIKDEKNKKLKKEARAIAFQKALAEALEEDRKKEKKLKKLKKQAQKKISKKFEKEETEKEETKNEKEVESVL